MVATGLAAAVTDDLLGHGPLATAEDLDDAIAETAAALQPEALIETINAIDLDHLQETIHKVRAVLCLLHDLADIAIGMGASRAPVPSHFTDPNDLLAIVLWAPAAATVIDAAAPTGHVPNELLELHHEQHALAEIARSLPADVRQYLTAAGQRELHDMDATARGDITARFRECVPATPLDSLDSDLRDGRTTR